MDVCDVYTTMSEAASEWKYACKEKDGEKIDDLFSSLHVDSGFLSAKSIRVGERNISHYNETRKLMFLAQDDVRHQVPMIFILQFHTDGSTEMNLEVGAPFCVEFEGA